MDDEITVSPYVYYGALGVGALAAGVILFRTFRGKRPAPAQPQSQQGMSGFLTTATPPPGPQGTPPPGTFFQGQSMGTDTNGIPIIAMPRHPGMAAAAQGGVVNLGQRTGGGITPQQAQQAQLARQQQAQAAVAQAHQRQQVQRAQAPASQSHGNGVAPATMSGAQPQQAPAEPFKESFGGGATGFGGEGF